MEVESQTQKRIGLGPIRTLTGKLKAQVVEAGKRVKKLAQDDPRRVTHSIKIGLALTVVSLIYYTKTLYDGFGLSGIWAILTVVVVFEFTVGATISKGLNRGFATLVAGALGVGAQHLSSLAGEKGEPFALGMFVFVLAAASTFLRFFPKIKTRYDYGVLIFILTFSMVTVSGYRVDEIVQLAHQRLATIAIGAASCMIISIFVCPVWAGLDLHNLVALNIDKVADYLEGFGEVYFHASADNGGSKEVAVSVEAKQFLQEYKSILNTKATEDILANFAKWEPGHGRFGFRHPWAQYLKIAARTRQCAYQLEALNGYIKAPHEFQKIIQDPCTRMSSESSKALKALSAAMRTMTDPSPANLHLDRSKNAIQDLKVAIKAASIDKADDLLSIVPAATVASILTEIVPSVERLSESVRELALQAKFSSPKPKVEAAEKPPPAIHRGSVVKPLDGSDDAGHDHVVIDVHRIITNKDFSTEGTKIVPE